MLLSSRDTQADDARACVTRDGGRALRGAIAPAAVVADVRSGDLRVLRRRSLPEHENVAVRLAGRDFELLVVARRVDAGDDRRLVALLARRPRSLALVAQGPPALLERCFAGAGS